MKKKEKKMSRRATEVGDDDNDEDDMDYDFNDHFK